MIKKKKFTLITEWAKGSKKVLTFTRQQGKRKADMRDYAERYCVSKGSNYLMNMLG